MGYRPPAVSRDRRRLGGLRHGVGREGGRDFEEEGNRGVPSVHARILKPIESLIVSWTAIFQILLLNLVLMGH